MPPFPHLDNPLVLLGFAACGLAGAIVAQMCKDGSIQLPRIYHKKDAEGDERTYIDPGFLTNALLGAAIAAYVDGRPITAVFAGIAVGYCGRDLVRPIIQAFIKETLKLNISFEPAPAAAPAPALDASKPARKPV